MQDPRMKILRRQIYRFEQQHRHKLSICRRLHQGIPSIKGLRRVFYLQKTPGRSKICRRPLEYVRKVRCRISQEGFSISRRPQQGVPSIKGIRKGFYSYKTPGKSAICRKSQEGFLFVEEDGLHIGRPREGLISVEALRKIIYLQKAFEVSFIEENNWNEFSMSRPCEGLIIEESKKVF